MEERRKWPSLPIHPAGLPGEGQIFQTHPYLWPIGFSVRAIREIRGCFLASKPFRKRREPGFGFGGEGHWPAMPGEAHLTRVQGMMRQNQSLPLMSR